MLAELAVGASLLCTPPLPADERERWIQAYIATRERFGFRADRAYILRLARRGRWAYFGTVPVTRAEDRYLRLRDRTDLSARAERYLRRHPGIAGGVSKGHGWPGPPYMHVRVTRRVAHHRRALRRLSPRYPLRVTRVARSERALLRVQDSISFRAHAADGFDITSTGIDVSRNAVVVHVITDRPDHAEYFRARYGPAVVTELERSVARRIACRPLDSYEPLPGGDLVLHWYTGVGTAFERLEVAELRDRVELGVVEWDATGVTPAIAIAAQRRVRLAAPLGERRVVDARTGEPLRLRAGR